MSKKEIRRAARDAFPKARTAQSARGRGTGGAYSKRQYKVSAGRSSSGRTASGRPIPRPPSVKRAVIFGVVAGVLYFLFIQWGLPGLFHVATTSVASNALVSAVGMLLFTAANYTSERFRYKRYMDKTKGSK